MKPHYVALSCALIAGCASSTEWATRPAELGKAGRCAEAHLETDNSGGPVDQRAGLNAAIYADCDHDNRKAIAYATLCARYGNSACQDMLMHLNAPVPTADLRDGAAPAQTAPASVDCVRFGNITHCE